MKKCLLIFFTTLTIYGNEESLFPSLEVEKGNSGIILSTNYKILNSKKTIAEPIKDIYRIINSNNDLIFERLDEDNLDNDYLLNLNVGYLKNDTFNSPNYTAILGTLLDEDTRIGLAINYNDFSGDYDNLKNKANGYQFNLFYSKKLDETSMNINLYAGTLNQKFKEINEEVDNSYYGLSTRYEYLEEDFNELYKGYRIDLNGKQLKQKDDIVKTKNTSVKASAKGIVKKEIEIKNSNISVEFLTGYEREFIEKKVYKNLMKDDFKDSINAEIKAGLQVKQVELYTKYEIKKSLNTSNANNIGSVGIEYRF